MEKGDRNEQHLAISIKKINSWLILFNDKLATNNFIIMVDKYIKNYVEINQQLFFFNN